jgi:hypothetical protein
MINPKQVNNEFTQVKHPSRTEAEPPTYYAALFSMISGDSLRRLDDFEKVNPTTTPVAYNFAKQLDFIPGCTKIIVGNYNMATFLALKREPATPGELKDSAETRAVLMRLVRESDNHDQNWVVEAFDDNLSYRPKVQLTRK